MDQEHAEEEKHASEVASPHNARCVSYAAQVKTMKEEGLYHAQNTCDISKYADNYMLCKKVSPFAQVAKTTTTATTAAK